jgi:hypothetical protein
VGVARGGGQTLPIRAEGHHAGRQAQEERLEDALAALRFENAHDAIAAGGRDPPAVAAVTRELH